MVLTIKDLYEYNLTTELTLGKITKAKNSDGSAKIDCDYDTLDLEEFDLTSISFNSSVSIYNAVVL